MAAPLKTVDIVINKCYGGFGLSEEAIALYNSLTGKTLSAGGEPERDDPHFVQVVRQLGSKKASGLYSKLVIRTVVDDYYSISEYDGLEDVYFRSRPTCDVRSVIFDSSLTNDQKVDRIRESYLELDRALELWKSLDKDTFVNE